MTQRRKLIAGAIVAAGVVARRISRRRAFNFQDKTVLITGGSRGLGLVLARRLAAAGARLALAARDTEQLQAASNELSASGADVVIFPADVTRRDDVERTVARVIEQFGHLDVLINNAGVMEFGPVENMSVEDFQKAMDTHFWGPLYTTLAVLPHMRQRGVGRIVNISSIGGRVAVPHLLPYAASKFALAGLSDAMRAELRKDGIYVTSVFPGLMRTGSHINARFKGRHRAEYAVFSMMAANPLLSMNADRAAAKIIEACRAGRPEVVPGVQAKLAIIANALVPNIVAEIMALTARVLPSPSDGSLKQSWAGAESFSAVAPSALTRLADNASVRNNETSLS